MPCFRIITGNLDHPVRENSPVPVMLLAISNVPLRYSLVYDTAERSAHRTGTAWFCYVACPDCRMN
jgi:hypothetical protein